MGSKHRMPQPAHHNAPADHHRATRAAGRTAPSNRVIGTVAAAVAGAGIVAGALAGLTATQGTHSAPPAAAPAPTEMDRPISQQGTIVALTNDSVTARSADGFTLTYRITPDTTTLTESGAAPADPTSPFAVNDEVEIVGAVQNGIAVATAVADRTRTALNGPPMHVLDVSNDAAAVGPVG